MTCYLDIHCQLCSSSSVCNSGSPLEVYRQANAHKYTRTHTYITCVHHQGKSPVTGDLCLSLWPPTWSIRWGKSVWGVGLNVKGKRCRRREVETCNRPTHPGWSQSRGGGTPTVSICLSSKNKTHQNITLNVSLYMIDAIYSCSQRCKAKWKLHKNLIKINMSQIKSFI